MLKLVVCPCGYEVIVLFIDQSAADSQCADEANRRRTFAYSVVAKVNCAWAEVRRIGVICRAMRVLCSILVQRSSPGKDYYLKKITLFVKKRAENRRDSRRVGLGYLKQFAEFTPRMRASTRTFAAKGHDG